MTKKFFCASVFALMASSVAAQDVIVRDAYIPVAPPGAMAHAAYMLLENPSEQTRSLIGASAPGYAMAHLHSSQSNDGVMTMTMVEQVDIAPGQSIALAPGGLHIMLMRPSAELAAEAGAGYMVDVTLLFANGETQTVSAQMRPHGADGS